MLETEISKKELLHIYADELREFSKGSNYYVRQATATKIAVAVLCYAHEIDGEEFKDLLETIEDVLDLVIDGGSYGRS